MDEQIKNRQTSSPESVPPVPQPVSEPVKTEATVAEPAKTEEKSAAQALVKEPGILNSALFPFLAFIIFGLIFFGVSIYLKPLAKDIGNETVLKIFQKYSLYTGWVFGLLSMIGMYVLYLIKKIVRLGKVNFLNPVILIGAILPWYFFAQELLLKEKRYTDIARGVITFIGKPLLWSFYIMAGLAVLWFVLSFLRFVIKKKPQPAKLAVIAGLLVAPLFLGGCVGDIQELICGFMSNGDHCFQGAAVQEADPYGCEKVSGQDFKDTGSNPPRDKCYLLIAENTGNLDVCKNIKGGLMSYTQEECILDSSVLNENPSGCKLLTGASKQQCMYELSGKITSDKVLEVDDQIQIIKDQLAKGDDAELSKQLKGLETKRTDMLGVMTKANKDEYGKMSDPVNRDIIGDFATGDIDSATKNKMLAFNDDLKKQGLTMTPEQYEKVKDFYKFKNDPANDIENMDDSKIVKDRFGEKVGNVVDKLKFWKTNDSAEEKNLDQQLRFYERMLERQAAIDKGLSEKEGEFEQTVDGITEKVKDKVADEVKDKLIEHLFGEATGLTTKVATAVVGEALDTVKAEAKSAEFRGLVKAYDDGMKEELGKFGGDVDKASAEVTKKLAVDPYTYASGDSFAKYGNLLENKDCDGTNPHCINRDVFWKAMKKSYKYQNK